MPAEKKSSVSTKLFGFAIVIAVIAFGAKSQMQVSHQQVQRPQLPSFAVPVDRSLLSQQLLPTLPGLRSMDEIEESFFADMPQDIETGAEIDQEDSPAGPSLYDLKLEDQNAWSSHPRQASLPSSKKRKVESSEKVSVATSQSPIVPGHEDPHRWYESQFLELAVSHDDQPQVPITAEDHIEFKALPKMSHEGSVSTILPFSELPTNMAPVAAIVAKEPSAKAVTAPSTRTVGADSAPRAWETGRY